jgi:hypothetical protein
MQRMTDQTIPYSAKDTLLRCKDEIQMLRSQIERLAPKAEAYDTLRQVLDLLPTRSGGYGPDVLWQIDSLLAQVAPLPSKGTDAND